MNDLCQKYGDKLVILAFPTNQFGHQENSNGEEILNALKHVRPGNGFEPKCILFEKVCLPTYLLFCSSSTHKISMPTTTPPMISKMCTSSSTYLDLNLYNL